MKTYYDNPNSYENLRQKMIEAFGVEYTNKVEQMAKDVAKNGLKEVK